MLVDYPKEEALKLPRCRVPSLIQLLSDFNRVHLAGHQLDSFVDDSDTDPLEGSILTLASLLLDFVLAVDDQLLDHASVRLIDLVLILVDVLVELAKRGCPLHLLSLFDFQLLLHLFLFLRHSELDLVALDKVFLFADVGRHCCPTFVPLELVVGSKFTHLNVFLHENA